MLERLRTRPVAAALTAAVAVLAVAGAGIVLAGRLVGGGGGADRPSIVLIVTDDQRADMMEPMPIVRERLAGRGVTFRNGFVVNPLCCPSRASILTGRWSHSTGVWRNNVPHGGFPSFEDSSTVATWLHGAGYETALVGKYLNRYASTYVPPGWDRFVALRFSESRNYYLDYELTVDGRVVPYGSAPEDYSTDVFAGHAEEFVRSAEGPIFLYFAPWAPHEPGVVPPRHEGLIGWEEPPRPPSHFEEDVSDKPSWVRRLPPGDPATVAELDLRRLDQVRTLPAVDEAVGRILDALADTGRLSNTLIVFTSDNGVSFGEHRWDSKLAPYEEDLRVPLVVRFDPLTADGVVHDALALNVDLAPTIAELAGVDAPGAEGMSLVPLLAGRETAWRDGFLIESVGNRPGVTSYCGMRTTRYTYVLYRTGEEELYDLEADPHQLENAIGDPALAAVRAELRARTLEACRPPPPGMVLPSE
ncbi:MAG: sulfatase [Actinobacteria bacterium]|nr:sulfatase [Actinomycetota bacterium]